MADTVPKFRPDTIVYLFNRNDFDLPLDVAGTFFRSHLLGRFRYLWQISVMKEERKRIRESTERTAVVVQDLNFMARIAAQNGADFVVSFMNSASWERIEPEFKADDDFTRGQQDRRVRVLFAEPVLVGMARHDDHLSAGAYLRLAQLLCAEGVACAGERVATSD
jgi:hypothetical protein